MMKIWISHSFLERAILPCMKVARNSNFYFSFFAEPFNLLFSNNLDRTNFTYVSIYILLVKEKLQKYVHLLQNHVCILKVLSKKKWNDTILSSSTYLGHPLQIIIAEYSHSEKIWIYVMSSLHRWDRGGKVIT